jgi:hypothetical protein
MGGSVQWPGVRSGMGVCGGMGVSIGMGVSNGMGVCIGMGVSNGMGCAKGWECPMEGDCAMGWECPMEWECAMGWECPMDWECAMGWECGRPQGKWPCRVVVRVRAAAAMEPSRELELPPGTFGWPVIGESIQMFTEQRDFYLSRFVSGPAVRSCSAYALAFTHAHFFVHLWVRGWQCLGECVCECMHTPVFGGGVCACVRACV